ncbi:MAG: class I SAM-dependent methyltransferase [Candidatus Berkiella sp.]
MNKFDSILKCPITGKQLALLNEQAVVTLNQRIAKGEIKEHCGDMYVRNIHAALKADGHDIYYPIEEHIYCLLPECALFGSEEKSFAGEAHTTKSQVKKFYDEFGWQENNGVFQDAKDSEDLRAVSQEYIQRCHLRLNQFLPPQGQYLLDVASGPVQYPAYLNYSKNFDYRICADISILALKEAQKKLGDKGIYLLCDVTNLPIHSDMIDATISLHTLYHVPANEQSKAFQEIHRVLKPGGSSVIVYSWGSKSLLMNILMLPQKLLSLAKRKLLKAPKGQTLYFHAHTYDWFCENIAKKYHTQLYSWRSVNVPFLKWFIHPLLGGRFILKFFYWLEDKAPRLMGKVGAYPLFVSKK